MEDPGSYHRAMPTWRCPHCGTPQAEGSRCWVCRRSSTSCATCRHFRQSVAAQVGYCGLDPRRAALRGDEIRGCWEARPVTAVSTAPPSPRTDVRRRLDFVPIGEPAPEAVRPAPAVSPAAPEPSPRYMLWAESEG